MYRLDYDGYPFWMHALTPYLRYNACGKEHETIEWIEQWVKPEDNFVDIGANVGSYSLVASKFAKKVYAFEPSSLNFALLLKNIKLNDLQDKIKLFPFKLSDYTALSWFNYNTLDFGDTNNGEGTFIKHPIYQFRLDDLFVSNDIGEPHHIKIDVDGHENYILNGMPLIFHQIRPKSLQIETDSNNLGKVAWICDEYGYLVDKVTKRNDPKFSNVLFVRKDLVPGRI